MSSLICWPTTRIADTKKCVVMMADSLYCSLSGSKPTNLLSLGPKIFPLPIRIMRPVLQRVVLHDSYGIGFVGNIIIAQAVISRVAAIFFNLYQEYPQQVPALDNFARAVLTLHREIAKSFNGSAETTTQYLLLGNCLVSKVLSAILIDPAAKKPLTRYTFDDPDQLIVLGDCSSEIYSEIQTGRAVEGQPETKDWIPKVVLENTIKSGSNKKIGGQLHGGILLKSGFSLRSTEITVRKTRRAIIKDSLTMPPGANFLTIAGCKYMPVPLEWSSWQDTLPN